MGPPKQNPTPSVPSAPSAPLSDGGSKRREYYAYVEEQATNGQKAVPFGEWLGGKR